jgi:hypothetical protein
MATWKDICGYVGRYMVSNEGEVMSLPKSDGNGNRHLVLKPDISHKLGYRRVTLAKDGKTKRYSVHRLVYETFVRPLQDGEWVNHIDHDPSNNRVSNLEPSNPKHNWTHSNNAGRQDKPRRMGAAAAAAANQQRQTKRWNEALGSRFIRTYLKGKRRRVEFYCTDCGAAVDSRDKDAPLRHGGRCTPCIARLKI